MSRTKRNHQADGVLDRARQAAAQAKPLARSTGAAARGRVRRARAWAAPRVERSGQVLQDSITPRVSAALSSAAQRLEPERPRGGRWRKLAGVSMLTAAAGAVAAFVRSRREPDGATSAGEAETDDVTPGAETRDGASGPSADVGANGRVGTSSPTSR